MQPIVTRRRIVAILISSLYLVFVWHSISEPRWLGDSPTSCDLPCMLPTPAILITTLTSIPAIIVAPFFSALLMLPEEALAYPMTLLNAVLYYYLLTRNKHKTPPPQKETTIL